MPTRCEILTGLWHGFVADVSIDPQQPLVPGYMYLMVRPKHYVPAISRPPHPVPYQREKLRAPQAVVEIKIAQKTAIILRSGD